MSMRISSQVELVRPITGQKIIDAVKTSLVDRPYDNYHQQSKQHGGKVLYSVGVVSGYPCNDCLIAVNGESGESFDIDPNATYDQISIVHHVHEGLKFAVGYTEEDVARIMREFKNLLQKELNRNTYSLMVWSGSIE